MEFMHFDLNLGADLRLRPLVTADAALLVEATGGEPGRSLWGAYPVGHYSLPSPSPTDPARAGCPGVGRSVTIPRANGCVLLAGGTRSRFSACGGAMLSLLPVP